MHRTALLLPVSRISHVCMDIKEIKKFPERKTTNGLPSFSIVDLLVSI
jgi:hypothetical protein